MLLSTLTISQHLHEDRNCSGFLKIHIDFSARCAIIGIYRKQRRKASMPRPPRCRRICGAPQVDTFCPNGCKATEPILLTLDEYEVIRLVDLEQQTHERCAAQMDISRSTVQEIYESARRKIAACLVHGKSLYITGGNYRICGGQETAHCGRCCRMQRANMENSGKLSKEIPL